MRRVPAILAISAVPIFMPACAGTGDSAADAGMRRQMEALAPDLSTDARQAKLAPGSGDVLENMYKENIVWADLQVREARL